MGNGAGNIVNRFWSELARGLSPYVPGEQPQIPGLVKLNTNESPFGPSLKAIEAVRGAAAETLRLYPDPQSTRLREALAGYHKVTPEQVFVGNGSDEVLAHTFAAMLKQTEAVRFPDVTYRSEGSSRAATERKAGSKACTHFSTRNSRCNRVRSGSGCRH